MKIKSKDFAEALVREFTSHFSKGDKVEIGGGDGLKQTGWNKKLPAGTTGTIVDKKSAPFGIVTYTVEFDTGDTFEVANAHLLLKRVEEAVIKESYGSWEEVAMDLSYGAQSIVETADKFQSTVDSITDNFRTKDFGTKADVMKILRDLNALINECKNYQKMINDAHHRAS